MLKITMALFARHIKSTIALIFYVLWWTYFFYWFTSGAFAYPDSCGAASGALVMLTLLFVAVSSVTLMVLMITSRSHKRTAYLIFLGLVLAPALYVAGYVFITH